MRPADDLLDLIYRRHQSVRDLPGWRSGPERLLRLLQSATRIRAMEIAHGVASNVPWESILAQIITWHHEIPLGEGHCGNEEAMDICVAALEAVRLDKLYHTTRSGSYEVRRRGDAFRLRHRWNPSLEAADVVLEHAAAPTSLPEITATEVAWIKSRLWSSRELPASDVLHAAAQRAKESIDAYRHAIPEGNLSDSFELDGGLTVGHAADVLSVVMGFASLSDAAAHLLKRTETTLVHIRRARLLEMIAELLPAVPPPHIAATIKRFTFTTGRSARISPLVELQGAMLLCPPLITPRLIDTILLRSTAYDPGRYGPIGQRQGRRAVKWKDWFNQIPDVLVAERLRVWRQDRRAAGDIDMVAIDPRRRRGVCLEVKWPIDAVSLPDALKIEDVVRSGAIQLDRIRSELNSGTIVADMPKDWPEFSQITWTWAVATPQQLCLRPLPFNDIYVTSFRYMASHGEARSLDDVIDTLTSPDLPIEGIHFHIDTVEFMLGRQKVIADSIVLTASWKPRSWHWLP